MLLTNYIIIIQLLIVYVIEFIEINLGIIYACQIYKYKLLI